MIHISRDAIFKCPILLLLDLFAILLVNLSDSVTASTLIILTVFNIFQTALIIIYCIGFGRIKKRFTLFAFNVAYFILLQGSYAMNMGNTSFYGTHIFAYVSKISYLNEAKGLMFILISQSIVFFAYALTEKDSSELISGSKTDDYTPALARWSKFFLVIGGIAAFSKLVLKIVYVLAFGYLSTYLSGGKALYENVILDLFDKFYYLGFYGYLATFPKMKEANPHILIYIIYSFLTLLTGIRGELVINVLFIVWYLSKRDELSIDPKAVLNKRKIIVLLLAGIISFSLLYEYGFSRFGQQSSELGFISKTASFISTQGSSGRLIALGLEYKDEMTTYISPILMVFYPIRNFLLNNSIVRAFTGGIGGQSLSGLSKAPSFGSVLTYVTNPGSYLNGSSLGTSYVAEVAVSLGMIGVVIISILLGVFFSKIDQIKLNNWSANVLWMNAFVVVTYIPRHATLQIIPESVAAIVFVIVVSFLSGKGSFH